jgi:hypothetical protein
MAWKTGSSSPGRAGYYLQHLGGRGLLLQRFAQLLFEVASVRLEFRYQ